MIGNIRQQEFQLAEPIGYYARLPVIEAGNHSLTHAHECCQACRAATFTKDRHSSVFWASLIEAGNKVLNETKILTKL